MYSALEIWLYTLWLFFSRISYQCLVWNNYGWVILQNAICPPAEFNLTLTLKHQDQSSLQTNQLSPPANCTKSSVLIHITGCSSVNEWKIAIQDVKRKKTNNFGVGLDFTHQDLIEFWEKWSMILLLILPHLFGLGYISWKVISEVEKVTF